MARAKKTHRAEARRNYRAAMAVADDLGDEDPDETADAAAAARPDDRKAPAKASASTGTVPPRPSIQRAFRGAFRPLDVPGDLRALPRLLIDKSFLIPLALIVGVAATVVAFGGKELISLQLSAFVLYPPPLIPVFVAGFLAPRASWLLGGLLGLAQSIAVLVIASTPSFSQLSGAPDAAVFVQSLFVSVVFGGFYAAAMAWYKRFLRAANPPRNAPAATRPSGKSKQGSSRPLLAKRR